MGRAIFKRSIFTVDGHSVLIRHVQDDTLYEYLTIGPSLGLVSNNLHYSKTNRPCGLKIRVDGKKHTCTKQGVFNRFIKDSDEYEMHIVYPNYKNFSTTPIDHKSFAINNAGGLIVVEIHDLKQVHEYPDHWRMKMYQEKGFKCSNPKCDREGAYFVKSIEAHNLSGSHIDIVTADFKLMTVDHILPKSKGGKNNVENLRPMCEDCNSALGNSMLY